MDEYIEKLKQKFNQLDEIRDTIIQTAIRVNRLSKTIIYSLIRGDIDNAKKNIEEIKKKVEELKKLAKEYPMFYNNAAISFQEYAEAMIMWYYITEKRIPTHEELDIDEVSYIGGLMDFVGELSRKATEEMIKGNIDFALEAKKIIENIYLKMLYMEFKNFELRKKVDYVSNTLNWLNEKIFYKTLFKDSKNS